MNVHDEITDYIGSHNEVKRIEMEVLHNAIIKVKPDCKLWFLDGRNEEHKVVSNPNIGYGSYAIKYTDGKTKEFYQIGLSSNKTGISVYILGIKDKTFLAQMCGSRLGKASVTGYCIKFKALKDIDLDVLMEAVQFGFENKQD